MWVIGAQRLGAGPHHLPGDPRRAVDSGPERSDSADLPPTGVMSRVRRPSTTSRPADLPGSGPECGCCAPACRRERCRGELDTVSLPAGIIAHHLGEPLEHVGGFDLGGTAGGSATLSLRARSALDAIARSSGPISGCARDRRPDHAVSTGNRPGGVEDSSISPESHPGVCASLRSVGQLFTVQHRSGEFRSAAGGVASVVPHRVATDSPAFSSASSACASRGRDRSPGGSAAPSSVTAVRRRGTLSSDQP